MSAVRVRLSRLAASGGKVGRAKAVRGIWAAFAVRGSAIVMGCVSTQKKKRNQIVI